MTSMKDMQAHHLLVRPKKIKQRLKVVSTFFSVISCLLVQVSKLQATEANQNQIDKDSQIERVEVVGTRIKRINTEGPSAVKQIKKESMSNSANVSVSDSLRDSAAATFGVTSEAAGNNAAATTNIGLRGLGSSRTLILLNGHRLPKDPSTEAVDLNLIPESAIERIEILRDGASALYGSDALGGVINIVTKKGFNDTEIYTKFASAEKKGGSALSTSVLSGFANEKSDLLTVFNFRRDEKILGRDRDVTKNGLSAFGSVAAYRDNSGLWVVDPSKECPPELLKDDISGNGKRCYFKYNEIATSKPLVNTMNLLTDYTFRTESGLKVYNRNLIVTKDIEWNYAPTPAMISTPTGTSAAPDARAVAYRYMEAGNRDDKDSERNFSTVLGLKGTFKDAWEYDVSMGYSRIFRKNQGVNGYLDKTILNDLIKNGSFDPFKAEGQKGDISSAITPIFQESESTLFTTDLVVSGDLELSSEKNIGTAFGVSLWQENLKQKTDDKLAQKMILGSAGSNEQGRRDVKSLFSEFNVPLTRKLEINLAARFDMYSDFGNTLNPKVSSKFNLSDTTLLRASIGTGFKAPSLSELYQGSSEGYQEFIDRVACSKNPAGCQSDQYLVYGGGNKKLKEEKAVTAGIGVVYESQKNFSMTVDAWYTRISNVVGIEFEELTKAELNGVNTSQYGVTVTRDSNGVIESIQAPNLNLQEEEISGIDWGIDMGLSPNFLGHSLSLENELSYLLFFKKEGFPGAGKRDIIGEWGNPGWRNNLTLSLKNQSHLFSVTLRTIPGQNVINREINEKINDLNEIDLAAAIKMGTRSQLTAGVKNLFNSVPPTDINGGTGGAAEVNGSLYDINGRRFFVGYNYKF